MANVGTTTAMDNGVYFYGGGPAYYVGPTNDIIMGTLQVTGSLHPTFIGPFSGPRATKLIGALAWSHLTGNPTQAEHPTLTRTSFTGCDTAAVSANNSPCFDVGSTFQASVSATWSGSTVTVTGGLPANARPFVDGMAVACSGCNSGLFILSVSAPPTQSTVSGAGQVGNTFTFTTNAAIGGSGSGTIAGGCSGTSGVGSNCIDFNFTINTAGTYGTAAALATCGVNNIQGTAANYVASNGGCVNAGSGDLVRGFKIGTLQAMYGVGFGSGNSYTDAGVDPLNFGVAVQSQAFTCNLVGSPATTVQCVKAPTYAYSGGSLSISLGRWNSGATFASYTDGITYADNMGALWGAVGGQSLPFTAGSGYTNGVYTVPGQNCSLYAFTTVEAPTVTVIVAGGSIADVYPSSMGFGSQAGCSFALGTFTFTTSAMTGSGATRTITVSGTPGGTIAPGQAISGTFGTATILAYTGTNAAGGAGTYTITCGTCSSNTAGTITNSNTIPTAIGAGSGGAITTLKLAPPEGVGGVGTNTTDNNMLGAMIYDNSGLPGNPLNSVFTTGFTTGCTRRRGVISLQGSRCFRSETLSGRRLAAASLSGVLPVSAWFPGGAPLTAILASRKPLSGGARHVRREH